MSWAIPYLVAVAVIAVVFLLPAWWSFRKEEKEARRLLAEAVASGRNEPVTIRPWVNLEKCMGSGVCVAVCPEGDVIQVLDGRAVLVNAASCVGHGACAAACPMDAIELRFGSERRGVDIPAVAPDFQSNVSGLYVAGELGGMGLIGNAVNQGSQAVANLAKACGDCPEGVFDLVIIGAGPAGIGASLTAKTKGLKHVILEQDAFGGSILHYPRKKIVMSHGLRLPGRKPHPAATVTKAELIALFREVIEEEALPLCEQERVAGVSREGEWFTVTTSKRTIQAGHVVLAVGRRGTPRHLGVPGEELPKVAYRMLDAEAIHHEHLLVVGGGDSAVEAALALSESPGNRVSLSYRRNTLTRPKKKNLEKLKAAVAAGRVNLLLESTVTEITPDRVVLATPAEPELVLPNDRVFVFAGGVLPTQLLIDAGIQIERHFGERVEVLA
jgi:thioredoxin reductase (NADPH)